MKLNKLPDFPWPITVKPNDPASVPPLRHLADRAAFILLEGFFISRLDGHAAPLTDAERAEALAIARAQIDADIDVIESFSGTVEAAASEAANYLSSYSLPVAALRLIHTEKNT